MSTPSGSDGRLSFGFDFRSTAGDKQNTHRSSDRPFRILLLADLSGRAQRDVEDASDLGTRPCLRVDLDTFDATLTRYAPRLDWPIGQVCIKSLDDFHPDQLYRQLHIFTSLRETRSKLKDPQLFSAAAQQLRSEGRVDPPLAEGGDETQTEGDVFSRLLGKAARGSDEPSSSVPPDAITSMIRQMVAPYILPEVDPQRDQYISSVDMAIGEQMRAILHHPDFQTLEATWRGIWELVTGLELDENLELVLLDATQQELLADLRTHMDDLTGSGLHRQFVDTAAGSPDGHPWSIIVGHYDFGDDQEDMDLLAGLGILAAHARAPFIADARPSLLGCDDVAAVEALPQPASDLPLFDELRKRSEAQWLGLAAPRILMRLPYGERGDEIDAFSFEELGNHPVHGPFLWGSAALACAKLLGMEFEERGWPLSLPTHLDLEDLPAYTVYTQEGTSLIPGAEIFMSERVSDVVSRRGVIALMSYRRRNAVRVRNIQSISDPPTELSGPWN